MSTPPLVSVIMTVYNGEKFVEQAIESILRQSWPNFEFIIVDDGSEDSTQEILNRAEAGDPRIRVISYSRIGRAKALNLAWRQSQGSYIANLDADDWAEPERLEKQIAFLRQHPEIGLLGTSYRRLLEGTGEEQIVHCPSDDAELRNTLIRRNPFVHSSVMIPRSVLEEVDGYNENYRVAIDYELWIRIAMRYQIANLPDVLTIKRVNDVAYFRNGVARWVKFKANVAIRWYTWRHLARPLADLRFVMIEPLRKYLSS